MTAADNDERMSGLIARLSGGDRRSPGAAGGVAADALTDPALVPLLVALMGHGEALIRMRTDDALERVSRERPDLVAPFAAMLVREIGAHPRQEIRWHVALTLPRLPRDDAIALTRACLSDRGRIVLAEAMSALAFFARDDAAPRAWLIPALERFAAGDVPSARSRARRLLKDLR